MLSHALSCRTAQIVRAFKQSDRFADRDVACIRQFLGETFHAGRHQRPADPPRSWTQTYHGLHGRGSCPQSHRTRQAERQQSSRSLAEGHGQKSERPDIQAFFISIGARYKRIRKRPRGIPSPQLYAYKTEKLQELEHLNMDGKIDLYYADESHVCTEGYVPYGWQFRDENVYIPSGKAQRVNIFGMIDRNNRYHGFTTTESIDAYKVVEYLDAFSLTIKKDTFIFPFMSLTTWKYSKTCTALGQFLHTDEIKAAERSVADGVQRCHSLRPLRRRRQLICQQSQAHLVTLARSFGSSQKMIC